MAPPHHRRVRVWSFLVRALHWSLAAAFAVAFASAEGAAGVHRLAGYAAVAIVGVRALWGLVGPRYERFDDFVPGPAVLLADLRDLVRLRPRRHLGHNPAGGAMIVALLTAMVATAASGVLLEAPGLLAGEAVGEAHETAAGVLLALVLVHVGGVVVSSLLHRENLVAAMITGRKRA